MRERLPGGVRSDHGEAGVPQGTDLSPLHLLVREWERKGDDVRGQEDERAQTFDVCAAQLRAAIGLLASSGPAERDTETGELFG